MGREEEFIKLYQILQTENQVFVCALNEMGGIGKTELAIKYAINYQNAYPGGICWLQARGSNVGTQLLSFARTNLEINIPDGLTFAEQIAYCWRNWREGTALIIYDDVQEYSEIQSALPPSIPQFKVLLTSRQKLGTNIQRINLNVLPPEKALELLQSLVTDGRIEAELEQAEALCKDLGYLPLAIELVGRYLDKSPTATVTKVQQQLESKKLAAKALLKHPQRDADMTAELGVAAAFELSWEKLTPDAQQLGCRLSLFALTNFKWEWVEACHPDRDADDLEAIRDEKLYGLNLLQFTERTWFSFHPLLREFFAAKWDEDAEEYKRRFCAVMVGEARKIEYVLTVEDIKNLDPIIPHLVETARNLITWLNDEDLLWPFTGLGRFYQGQGLYQLAEPWLEDCRQVVSTRLGDNHLDVAISLNNLATLYFFQSRYEAAETLYREALAMKQRLLGDNHPDMATSLNNLAALYSSQGRYEAAEPLYREALAMSQRLLGDNHPSVAISLNNLATLYSSQGRYEAAEPLYREALAMSQRLLGDNHPSVAASLNNLALLYNSQGRYEEAEPLCREALGICLQKLGENHPHTISVKQSLKTLQILKIPLEEILNRLPPEQHDAFRQWRQQFP